MDKRTIGTETIMFVDGTKKEFEIFSVAARKVSQIKKLCRVTKFTSKAKFESIEANADDVAFKVMKLAFGSEMSQDDLDNNVETDIEEIYRKYFDKSIGNDEKKDNTSE